MPARLLKSPAFSLRARRALDAEIGAGLATDAEVAAAVEAGQPDPPPPSDPGPSTPAIGQNWRDETANRARATWMQLHPDRAVQINWTFWQNSNAPSSSVEIRVVDDPDNWANAVWITPAPITMTEATDSVPFTALIPPGMYVQCVGDSGVTFRKALELTL